MQALGMVALDMLLLLVHTYADRSGDEVVRTISVVRRRGSADGMNTESRDGEPGQLVDLAELPDEAIDTSDLPESGEWSGAECGGFYRPLKGSITIHLDADVIK